MNIGIDIDGTINNFQDVVSDIIYKKYKIKCDKSQYELFDNIPDKDYVDFMEQHSNELLYDVKPEDNSVSVIESFAKSKHDINIITARGYHIAENTIKWLKMNRIYYDNIYFSCGDKVDVCKWLNIDIMIEDKPENIISLSDNGVNTIIYDQLYNQYVQNSKNITRARNWASIYETITYNLNYSLRQ